MHGVLELNESQSNEFKTKKNKNRKKWTQRWKIVVQTNE